MAASVFAQFSAEEATKIRAFWSEGSRYAIEPTPEYVVRLTTAGSRWLWALNNKRGSVDADADWNAWVDAKVNYDRWAAAISADRLNQSLGFPAASIPAPVPAPGPMPEGLRFLVGDAPLMADAVRPQNHVVRFSDAETFRLQDHAAVPVKYPSYRFSEGVRHFGTPVKNLPESELTTLFASAGISESQRRVFSAVSMLEGGFDSVNTYDTGFVSVGMIQFACLAKGSGSLGQVLRRQKLNAPAKFESDFRRFGVDVNAKGELVALDMESGQTKTGLDAAMQIIADPRLIAAFHRAGQKSQEFRVAQLMVAKDMYFPAGDLVTLQLDGKTVSARVGDFVRSEAGLATLMDRKVHKGNLGPLASIANAVAQQNGIKTVEGLVAFEEEIVRRVQHRRSFLGEDTLSQPAKSRRRR